MKIKFATFILLLTAFQVHAQWSRTNVSPNLNVTIEDLIEHNGNLYAALFDSGLVKLNNVTNKWEKVKTSLPPSSNSAHITRMASSGNFLYAFVNNQTCASTLIYKSEDNGLTFVADSSGHPLYGSFPAQCKGYPFNVANAFVLNGKIITVINGGFYSKYPTDSKWVKTTDPKVTFAELFAEYNNNWYAWSDNYKLHVSSDSGSTWSTPSNTGLPNMFLAKVMNVNPSNGRIYVAGKSITTSEYKLLYSDDEGAKWDSLPINQYLKSDWIGFKQALIGMISNGNNLTAMMVNNANSTHPDVISSIDGGQTWVVDTVGLQANAAGTIGLRRLLYYKNKLYLTPNYFDIYTQGTSSTDIVKTDILNTLNVYPNPVSTSVTISSVNDIEYIKVCDATGKVMFAMEPNSSEQAMDLSGLSNGVYFVSVMTSKGLQQVRLIKQ